MAYGIVNRIKLITIIFTEFDSALHGSAVLIIGQNTSSHKAEALCISILTNDVFRWLLRVCLHVVFYGDERSVGKLLQL